jgi:hypothetical protein
MATRAVLNTFEKYQKERVAFVTQVAEMAKNPQVCGGDAREGGGQLADTLRGLKPCP